MKTPHLTALAALILAIAVAPCCAQNVATIDASVPGPPPEPVRAALGTAKNPAGDVIGANSEYLTFNGKPWLPVMGEFHYSRYPEAEWEQEILKMKAAGVDIISAYVIWIHHEQTEGVFDWSGQRDLRRFVELCGKHGMYVYPRIGPWAHAETRNGGLPDWVLKNGPTRQNNPVYLKEVQAFYQQIGQQLKGELWKDGGPVVGIQIENEYRGHGPGKGDEHIRTLKKMAIEDGLDVPLYTVTGWDGAAIPLDAVLPVFGGYPDAPWDGSPSKLPANEVYAFRFNNRAAGSMGAIGGGGQNSAESYKGTPFLTAEIGDGIEDTYFRRPVVSADDVAVIPTIMLGSGANLLGYYMFHGGRNPDGGAITLQESQVTGYPTDVPVKSYDFQAPLGEFGQERESLRKLKLVHYFVADFGDQLAPMFPHAPAQVPSGPTDNGVARVSARTSGDAGFIFLSNAVRGLDMPARPGFQVELKLPAGTVKVPQHPIDLPSGAYGIWPVNLPLPGASLRYSTAQLFKRVDNASGRYMLFFAIPGIRPEFAFDGNVKIASHQGPFETESDSDGVRVRMRPDAATDVVLASGVHLLLLPEAFAEQIWRTDDPSLLLATKADAFTDKDQWTIESTADRTIDFGLFGAFSGPTNSSVKIEKLAPAPDFFTQYRATLPEVNLKATVTKVADAQKRGAWKFGPALSWRRNRIPLAPEDEDFMTAAVWKISLPALPSNPTLSDAFLSIDYQGDAARLYRDGHLVDDNLWNGAPWMIGLREVQGSTWTNANTFELRILPLPKDFGMYLEDAAKLHFDSAVGADSLGSVRIVPQYRLTFDAPAGKHPQ